MTTCPECDQPAYRCWACDRPLVPRGYRWYCESCGTERSTGNDGYTMWEATPSEPAAERPHEGAPRVEDGT